MPNGVTKFLRGVARKVRPAPQFDVRRERRPRIIEVPQVSDEDLPPIDVIDMGPRPKALMVRPKDVAMEESPGPPIFKFDDEPRARAGGPRARAPRRQRTMEILEVGGATPPPTEEQIEERLLRGFAEQQSVIRPTKPQTFGRRAAQFVVEGATGGEVRQQRLRRREEVRQQLIERGIRPGISPFLQEFGERRLAKKIIRAGEAPVTVGTREGAVPFAAARYRFDVGRAGRERFLTKTQAEIETARQKALMARAETELRRAEAGVAKARSQAEFEAARARIQEAKAVGAQLSAARARQVFGVGARGGGMFGGTSGGIFGSLPVGFSGLPSGFSRRPSATGQATGGFSRGGGGTGLMASLPPGWTSRPAQPTFAGFPQQAEAPAAMFRAETPLTRLSPRAPSPAAPFLPIPAEAQIPLRTEQATDPEAVLVKAHFRRARGSVTRGKKGPKSELELVEEFLGQAVK